MTNQERLAQAIDLLRQVQRDLSIPTVPVVAGTDLHALFATLSPGATVVCAPDFVWRGQLTIPKPLTLIGGIYRGSILCAAPDISLRAFDLEGTARDETLITCSDRTTIEDGSLRGSSNGQRRGIAVNAESIIIRRTAISNIWHDQDAQCIAGWSGTNGLIVEDCPKLEASGQSLQFGGSDPPFVAASPKNIAIRRCYLSKPIAWRTLAACTCKNLLELKNATSVLIEDVTMETSFVKGQDGFAVLLNVRNQDGRAPFSTLEDITMRRITIRHVAGGLNLLGSDDTPGKPSGVMKRVLLEDWTVEDISNEWGVNQRSFQMKNGGEDVTLRRMTFSGPRPLNSIMTFDGSPWTRLTVDRCEFDEGYYGIHSPDFALGVKTLDHYAPGYVWTDNIVHTRRAETGRVIPYPTGTVIR